MKIFTAAAMLLVMMPRNASAQFYPDSLANWCLYNNVSPAGVPYAMHMLSDPDTVINGMVYKRIDPISPTGWDPFCYDRFYVRSSSDGKGYMYVPEFNMEYMTGDLDVNVGDTLCDVLIADGTFSCPNVILPGNCDLALVDVVVTSIDTITNAGVTVVRHYVWPLCTGAWAPLFWQAGIGTEHGPLLVLTPGLAYLYLRHASVGDTCYYSWGTLPQGLPGGPACCVVIPNSIDEHVGEASPIRVYPNPSSGIFTAEIASGYGSGPQHLSILDAMGRTVVSTITSDGQVTFDQSGRSGLFMLLVEGDGRSWSTRVIIE